ncbi:endonuclease/exonuclease/phosphatase family protein [Anatilimnocola sp. NA78]|uniref:endonuclease/exonuclease/phosphatase family protein n=1 Tax=Anatilimnocola sp. NA78 TaxID=3415683 RepID=UPI003CE51B04
MSACRSISRRFALQAFACGALSLSTLRNKQLQAAEDAKELRVIAYNVYECTGWPKERAMGKRATALGQMPARFAQELALYEPDIIAFSESPAESVTKEIARLLKMHHVRFPSGGKWPGTLLSRYEILESQNAPLGFERPKDLFTRHWGRAVIKLPHTELVLHSAHLNPFPESDVRMQEIPAMLKTMVADQMAGRSMLVIGDLNHQPLPPEYPLWEKAGWIDTFTQLNKTAGLTFRSDTPEKRLDYILAYGPIAKQLVEARPLWEGAFRVNNADEQSFALSDHVPQFARFEWSK